MGSKLCGCNYNPEEKLVQNVFNITINYKKYFS